MIVDNSDKTKAQNGLKYTVGVGLTNECDLSCAHCYRSQLKVDRLSLKDIKEICRALSVGSINLGVGENGLHPEYHQILDWLYSEGIKVAITSNGYSIEVLADEELARLHSVEFSLDYPTEEEQDNWRGQGNWQKCWSGIARCQRLGVPVAAMAVMMNTNYLRLSELANVAGKNDINLRFNLYQPVTGDTFSLSYAQFWEGLLDVLGSSEIIAISEPLINALLDLPQKTHGSPCGRTSVRVLPNGLVSPCIYWPLPDRKLKDLIGDGEAIFQAPAFARTRQVPSACEGCRFVETCGGGCGSRRMLRGQLREPDEYCPVVRHDNVLLEKLKMLSEKRGVFREMPKVGNACTFMVRG